MQRLTITGRLTMVQESRFRVVTDDGRAYLFTLDRRSSSMADLPRFQRERTRVEVEYEGQPNFYSGVARAVRQLDRD